MTRSLLHRLVTGTALALILGLVLVALPDSSSQPTQMAIVATDSARTADVDSDMVYVLAVGSDQRPGEDLLHTRGDAIQMVSINTRTGAAAVIGVPRDSYVSIPGHGHEKINAALYFGGPKLFGQTVGDLVGIQPDYVFLSSFKQFQRLVGGIGGVEINNPFYFDDEYLKEKASRPARSTSPATRRWPTPGSGTACSAATSTVRGTSRS